MKIKKTFGQKIGHMAAGRIPRQKEKIGIGLLGKKTSTGFVGYSPGFKRFAAQHKGALTEAFRLFNKMISEKKPRLENKKMGIVVSKKVTGSYKGNAWSGKVQVAGREFFAKKTTTFSAQEMFKGIEALDSFLKEKARKMGKFNVRAIKPLLLLERRGGEAAWLVTPFYRKGDVEQALDAGGKEPEIYDAIFSVSRELVKRFPRGFGEIDPKNAFYQKSTNTILLFDIHLRQ